MAGCYTLQNDFAGKLLNWEIIKTEVDKEGYAKLLDEYWERQIHLYKDDEEELRKIRRRTGMMSAVDKYLRVNQQLGSLYDLCNVHDLEFRFLPKEYHEVNNLFIFACIKYISHLLDDGTYNSNDGFFASQLTTNLFMLHTDRIDEEHKNLLLTNIQEFLDIIK